MPRQGCGPNLRRLSARWRVRAASERNPDLSVPTSGALRGGWREAHVPTQQPSSCQEARLSPADAHPRRPGRAEGPPRQGSAPSVGLIWRIRDRGTFQRLSREGRRSRAGVLWCTAVLDPSLSPPRVAFAIGRAYGPAVQRNRVRRQLRSLLSEMTVPPGAYLIGARPDAAARSYPELRHDLQTLISAQQRNHHTTD